MALAPHVKHLLATDLSSKMIDIARAKAAAEGIRNVTFEAGTLETLEADTVSFDAILGHSILHLVGDRAATLHRVFALLKPGGVFISSTPCLADSLGWLKWVLPVMRWVGKAPPNDVAFFRRSEFEDELAAAGFGLDYVWQPGKGKAVFIVARRPETAAGAKVSTVSTG